VCRVLHDAKNRAAQAYAGVSFSPDSRLLATGGGEVVCLWGPQSGRLLGRLNSGPTTDVLFDPGGRYLYTTGERGPQFWALASSGDEDGVSWRVERPRPLPDPCYRFIGFQLHTDREGKRLAVVNRFVQVAVGPRPGIAGPHTVLQGHPQVSSAAVSPDGRYVATGTWRGQGVKVWEGEAGRLVCDLPAEGSAGVAFTPDGSRLLVMESEGTYRSYRVGTWKQDWERRDPDTGFTRDLRTAFHPAGRVMAQVSDRVNLRLVDWRTGEELTVLPVPESQNLSGCQFSPDGRYVAAVTVRGTVQLWDLLRLRACLREIGLDWDPPARDRELPQDDATRLEIVPAAGGD
jgi:WD40 repeat protein